nr:hypothetical protein [Tanacetum cinerariifolium]
YGISDEFGVKTSSEQKLVLNGCMDWNETTAHHEIQVSDVGLTYYCQKKQKSRRKQRKENKVPHTEPQTEKSVPTTSNDPLPSGEDRMQLTELMNLCTNLQKHVLDLEKAKTAQAKEIVDLKKMVKKLERKKKSRTLGRMNEEDMFRVNDLDGDEVTVDAIVGEEVEHSTKVAEKEVSTVDPVTTTEIKAAKPKARGVIVQEPREFGTTPSSKPSQLPQDKDKDHELAEKLQAEKQGELTIEERSKLFVELMNERKKYFARLRP